MKDGNRWVTADNRRLWVFRELERLGKCDKVPVRQTYYIPDQKRTSFNGGSSVQVRGDPGGRWHSKPSARKNVVAPTPSKPVERWNEYTGYNNTLDKSNTSLSGYRATAASVYNPSHTYQSSNSISQTTLYKPATDHTLTPANATGGTSNSYKSESLKKTGTEYYSSGIRESNNPQQSSMTQQSRVSSNLANPAPTNRSPNTRPDDVVVDLYSENIHNFNKTDAPRTDVIKLRSQHTGTENRHQLEDSSDVCCIIL